MSKKLTLNNVFNYLQAHSRKLYDLFIGLKPHEKEQINYRMSLCSEDCAIKKECIKCRCDYPDKLFQIKSCNPDRFPDVMSKVKWDEFKRKNNIEIDG